MAAPIIRRACMYGTSAFLSTTARVTNASYSVVFVEENARKVFRDARR